jgi:ABC-2 type transport system ATP-binding protein
MEVPVFALAMGYHHPGSRDSDLTDHMSTSITKPLLGTAKSDRPKGLEVNGISKSLRGRPILDGVDLVVPQGSVAVIQGDNGAGKTTLVRILATVVSPDRGTALVDGYDVVTQANAVRQSIGVSFANERSLYWRITGLQNLELFGRIGGLSKRVVAKRSLALCDALQIGEAARGWVARMSTGQRQRLMVARALLNEPAVLLLDEPFRGLDEEGLHALLTLVRQRAQRGMTALIVAPLIEAVLPIADTSYRMENGALRILADDAHDLPKEDL